MEEGSGPVGWGRLVVVKLEQQARAEVITTVGQ